MWDSAFLTSAQTVTHALLCKPVLPAGGKPFERVSAAIAVRTALGARAGDKTLLFVVPEATQSTALHIGAALLVGNYAHVNGNANLPADEVRPLFKGDLLLVTPAVSATKGTLEHLRLGQYYELRDFWEISPLSRYTAARGSKPRVFLANPGWTETGAAGRRFGAVVIDASHPRALENLPELLRAASGCSSIRIAVLPPVTEDVLKECGYPSKAVVWLWDPQAQADAFRVADEKPEAAVWGQRIVWQCDGDQEGASLLGGLHKSLTAILRQAGGVPYAGYPLAWSIYSRLRVLAAPLAQLEQDANATWFGTLRQRVEALGKVSGHGNPLWDATWPSIRDAVKAAYEAFLKRQETAKFWALAARVEGLVKEGTPIRIVVGTESELQLLQQFLVDLIDGLDDAIGDGVVELVTPLAESRLVAEGDCRQTLLLGPRPRRYRYLDVFPSHDVEVFSYPYEEGLERATQERNRAYAKQLGGTESRLTFLSKLGLRPASTAKEASHSGPPAAVVRSANTGKAVKFIEEAEVCSDLDIDAFAEERIGDPFANNVSRGDFVDDFSGRRDSVEVWFAQGTSIRYLVDHPIDVYFTATSQVERKLAGELRAGWCVVSFVDGRYDTLFKRLTEAIEARLKSNERAAMVLWRKAKEELLRKFATRRELHRAFEEAGGSGGYEVLTTWLRDDAGGSLAPQHFEDFEKLAKLSGVYSAPSLAIRTFQVIRKARGRNRLAGRKLRAFLRAVVSGDGFDDALESARGLDTALGDVLAAVEVLEVSTVEKINRS